MLFTQSLPVRFLMLMLAAFLAAPALAAVNDDTSKDPARFKTLYEYALIANAAYQSKHEIEKILSARGYTLTAYRQMPGYEVSYFLATNDTLKQQILSVRGTSNIENALVDVAIKLLLNEHTGNKLHHGFATSADSIYNSVKPELNKNYRINTTGHSLGGAAALVLAMYLDADGYDVGKVVTFGQPKVTNIAGSRQFSHLDVTRVVTPKDIVPLVPPLDPMNIKSMDIYWHLGTEVVLQEGNTYSELEGLNSMMRATDFLNEMVTEKNLQHHFMSVYINSLTPKLVNAKRVPYENDFSIYDWFGNKNTGTSGK